MKRINELVVERTRKGRRKPERTCSCDAAAYPHRLGSVTDCYGDLICAHGLPTWGHPAWDGRCPECDREEAADIAYDLWRDERLRSINTKLISQDGVGPTARPVAISGKGATT